MLLFFMKVSSMQCYIFYEMWRFVATAPSVLSVIYFYKSPFKV